MAPRDRYKFLEYCLHMLGFEEREKCLFVTLLLPNEVMADVLNGKKAMVEVAKTDRLYIQDWITNEDEAMPFVEQLDDAQEKYAAGDEEAIFRFCRYRTNAFRYWWVVDQVEKWQRENTADSLSELRRLFAEFVKVRGQSNRTKATELLVRDRDMYVKVSELVSSGSSTTQALHQTAHQFYLSYEVARQAYYKFNKYRDEVATLESNFRGVAVGFGGDLPRLEQIDPVLEKVFGLRTMLERTGNEIALYQSIRKELCDLDYHPGWGVWRSKDPTVKRAELDDVLNKYQHKYWRDRQKLHEMYTDYAAWEKLRNSDERDVYKNLTLYHTITIVCT